MRLSVQRIFQEHLSAYAAKAKMPRFMWRAANAISACRTPKLGAHRMYCPDGHEERIAYNSCRHRSCSRCAAISREKWLGPWCERLLDCPHHHVVFTVPHELNTLWRYNRESFSDVLFAAASKSLQSLLADPKYLGARPGLLAALHTWSQSLAIHVHLHVLVTAGGLDAEGRWRVCVKNCLLPRKVLMIVFRGKLREEILKAFEEGRLELPPGMRESQLRSLLNKLGRQVLNVKIHERYDHARGVVRYLARYLRGGPLSDRRLISVNRQRVRFRCRASNGESVGGEIRLTIEEFLGRFLQHVPPPGMPTVRGYGLYAGCKHADLNRARDQRGQQALDRERLRPQSWFELCELGGRSHQAQCSVCQQRLVVEVLCCPSHNRGPPSVCREAVA